MKIRSFLKRAIPEDRELAKYGFQLFAITVLYVLSGKLALQLAFSNSSASAFWPPAGIAIAAFLYFGYRMLPAIFAGAYLVNITTTGVHLTSFFIALGNTLEGFVIVLLINKYAAGKAVFERIETAFKFIFIIILGTLISPCIGVSILTLKGLVLAQDYPYVWLTWWIGDLVGALQIAPLVFLWLQNLRLNYSIQRVIHLIVALFFSFLIGFLVFHPTLFFEENYKLTFLMIVPLLWIAFNFGKRETTATAFLLSLMSIFFTLGGLGPFFHENLNDSLIILQLFIGTICLITLLVGAALTERRKTQEQIRKSYNLLKQTDILKDQFLVNTSHELKTPITPILIQAEMLSKGKFGHLNSKQKKSTHIILRNMNYFNQLITDIFSYSIIKSRSLKLKLERTRIELLLNQAIQSINSSAKEKNIKIIKKIHSLPPISVDKQKILQVLLNLLSNAIKFSSRGKNVYVEIEKKNDYIYVKVHSRTLIKKQDLPHLFKPFFQGKQGDTPKPKGTGLGLAICKGIIEEHGGNIWLQESSAKGTTFTFTLPLTQKL